MSSTLPTSPLIWLDLEFTDLNVDKGRIVEIATLITDGRLNVKAIGPDLVIHQSDEILKSMIKWNQEHFRDSGLYEEIRQSKITTLEAEEETLNFLKKFCVPGGSALAGASVYVDRDYLRIHMPRLYNFVHHRVIDTNTLKELMHRWYPNIKDYPNADYHRAGKDILETINELKYYQASIFK